MAENLTSLVLSFVKQQERDRRQRKKSYLTSSGYIERKAKKKKNEFMVITSLHLSISFSLCSNQMMRAFLAST